MSLVRFLSKAARPSMLRPATRPLTRKLFTKPIIPNSTKTSFIAIRVKVSMLKPFEVKSEIKSKLQYYRKPYHEGHWALSMPTTADKNFIAVLEIHGVKIGLKLNPTDARGYRGIASLISDDKATMGSTVNREYSMVEELALSTALTIFARAYKNHGLIAQISVAGNNSQSVNPDGSVQIGNDKEPSLLHGHIIGRGNPEQAYIAGVTLKGPKAGFEINLRGDGSDEGNKKKEKWIEKDMMLVAAGLAEAIVKILTSSPEFVKVKIASLNQDISAKQLTERQQQINHIIGVGIVGLFSQKSYGDVSTSTITPSIKPKT